MTVYFFSWFCWLVGRFLWWSHLSSLLQVHLAWRVSWAGRFTVASRMTSRWCWLQDGASPFFSTWPLFLYEATPPSLHDGLGSSARRQRWKLQGSRITYHFCHILLINAAGSDLKVGKIDLTFWWEELQSHMAKGPTYWVGGNCSH